MSQFIDIDTFAPLWQERQHRRIALLDVRERWEYNAGHIPDATPMPLGTLWTKAAAALPDREATVVICETDDQRGKRAGDWLREAGWSNVALLSGGLTAWADKGNPRETGWAVSGKRVGEVVVHEHRNLQWSAREVHERLAQGRILVLDIRTPWEHAQGHIPGAYNVPAGTIAQNIGFIQSEIERGHFEAVVTHCSGRTRGIMAAAWLREFGLPAWALENGTMGWRLLGEALEETVRRPDWLTPPNLPDNTEANSVIQAVLRNHASSYLIDVRERSEHEAGHPTGALPIPAGQILLEGERWLALRALPIIVFDDSGDRARWASQLLERLGASSTVVVATESTWRAAGGEWGRHYPPIPDATNETLLPSAMDVEAADLDPNSVSLIDVRSLTEWTLGSIPGALSIPAGLLLPRDITGHTVLVSEYGVRARMCAAWLSDDRVRVLKGGMEAWRTLGLALEEHDDVRTTGAADSVGLVSRRTWRQPIEKLRKSIDDYLRWETSLNKESK